MRSDYRSAFNAAFSDDLYQRYVDLLSERTGCVFDFRLTETPVFLPDDLREQLVTASREIVDQLCDPAKI